jgi:hypothetical protein
VVVEKEVSHSDKKSCTVVEADAKVDFRVARGDVASHVNVVNRNYCNMVVTV